MALRRLQLSIFWDGSKNRGYFPGGYIQTHLGVERDG